MLSLIVVALVTVAAGFVVWANDKRHAKYGIAVPAGVSLTAGMVSWIIFIAAGLGYQPGLTWIPWVLPMVLGAAAAVAAVLYLGKTRTAATLPGSPPSCATSRSPGSSPASVTTTRPGAWSRFVKAPSPFSSSPDRTRTYCGGGSATRRAGRLPRRRPLRQRRPAA